MTPRGRRGDLGIDSSAVFPGAVVLGSSVTSLSITRALGRAGISVTVLGDGSDCPLYCRRFVKSDESAGDLQEQWLAWLLSHCEGAVILAASDDGMELIARRRTELVQAGHLPIEGNDAASLAMLDKATTYEIAASAEVRVPQSVVVRSIGELDVALAGIEFPWAYKACQAHRFQRLLPLLPPDTPLKGGLAADADEMRARLVPILEHGVPMLLTEFVPGPAEDFYSYNAYIDERGKPLMEMTTRKLRQNGKGFGNGTLLVTQWCPEVAKSGLRLALAAGILGIACVEFKRDERDGRFTLIECNVRPTMFNDLIRRSGIDLALLAYNRSAGRPAPTVDHFREGIMLWDPYEDWRAFLKYRAAGELTTSAWLRSLAHRKHVRVLDPRDPCPILTRMVWRGRSLTRRLRPYFRAVHDRMIE